MLTSNLRELEEKGVLTRQIYAEVPPRVEYTLTAMGESLRPILDSLATWGEHYRDRRRHAAGDGGEASEPI